MKLHRIKNGADWEQIAAKDLNRWQTGAIATHGIVTPGNIVTIAGFGITLSGLIAVLQHFFLSGALLILAGRLADIVDGYVADKTGTKSPLGEALDAGIDKLITLLVVIGLFAAHITTNWLLVALLAPHVLITSAWIIQKSKKHSLHPARSGKLSMALAWIALIGLVCSAALHGPLKTSLLIICYLLVAISVALGLYTAVRYASRTSSM